MSQGALPRNVLNDDSKNRHTRKYDDEATWLWAHFETTRLLYAPREINPGALIPTFASNYSLRRNISEYLCKYKYVCCEII